MAQGNDLTNTPGTNTLFVLGHEQIKNISSDRTVTYAKIIVNFQPQKAYPNQVHITAGSNLITYPGELTTRTADLTTSNVLWNSVISTKGAKFAEEDIKNFLPRDATRQIQIHANELESVPPSQINKLHTKFTH